MKLLVYPALKDEERQQLAGVDPSINLVNAQGEDEALAEIVDAEAMYGTLTPELLERAKELRWLQTPIAGLENYMFPELAESDLTMSNMAGIYNDQIADHTMTYMLMFARGFHIYLRRQIDRNWETGVPIVHLADATIGIIGLGGIGTAIAQRAKAAEMRVIATEARRDEQPDFVDELWPPDRLDDLLAESDFVVSCVPHTPATEGMIGAEQLTKMQPSAYLINISRGVVVKLEALVEALQSGTIAGAGLDVYEIEPLPSDHPLWGTENVILTPHVAAASPHVAQRRIDVVAENLRRWVNDEPLRNVVDKKMWF